MADIRGLDSILRDISKKFGDGVARVGVDRADRTLFSLGSPGVDYMTYNSVPEGAWIELSGQESSGKAQPLTSPVFTEHGFIPMGQVKVGTKVYGADGKLHNVIGVFPQGIKPVYRVTFNDGTSTECSDEHLWTYNPIDRPKNKDGSWKLRTISLREMIDNGPLYSTQASGSRHYKYRVPLCKPLQFDSKELPIDPYLLGCLIGDGALKRPALMFTNSDEDTIAEVDRLVQRDWQLQLVRKSSSKYDYAISAGGGRADWIFSYRGRSYEGIPALQKAFQLEGYNISTAMLREQIVQGKKHLSRALAKKYPSLQSAISSVQVDFHPAVDPASRRTRLWEALNALGLACNSEEKRIPHLYKWSSVEDRLNLLQGLMDTDGFIDKAGHAFFYTSSQQLAEDVQFLVKTLGGKASLRSRTAFYTMQDGQAVNCRDCYTVGINLPANLPLVRCSRKVARRSVVSDQTSQHFRAISNVEYLRDDECQCILVDSEEHLYLTDDFIVTHNTLLAYCMAADYSRKEMKKPEEERRHILFVDCEGTFDPEWAYTAAHYDVNDQTIKTYYLTPTGQSAEQIFDMIRDFAASGQIGLIILDSLTAMAPQQTYDESFEKKEMGGISKPLADFVKRCTGLFNKNRTTFVGINGSITNISGYGQAEITGGGTYFKRACSLRLRIKKSTPFDDDWNELKTTAENPAGHLIEVALLKSKFCRADRRLGFVHLNYRKGVDLLWDTIEVASNIGLIDNSTQGYYKLLDPATGELLCDEDGKEIKIKGKKNLKPYFESHPELWKSLYDRVYEEISRKDNDTIKSFEELMNINVAERFNISAEDQE